MFKSWKRILKDQRGITGLETAIILIAFVVVASVFSYTVLAAGIFSSEKGKEAIYSGLEQASSTLEMSGSVKAIGARYDTIDNADALWTAGASVTVTLDTTDKQEGTASVELLPAAAFSTGVMAYKNITANDISNHLSTKFWIKSSLAFGTGTFQLVLDDTAACVSPLETVAVPALAAATWTKVQVKMASPALLTSVACVGLSALVDPVTPTINVDYVEAPDEVKSIQFLVSNSLSGSSMDLTTTADSDADGLLSDETTKTHLLIANYLDTSQYVKDITWSKVQIGKGDADNQLESGEKMEVTVNLTGLNPVLGPQSTFTLELAPEKGGVMYIQRSIPGSVDDFMDLR